MVLESVQTHGQWVYGSGSQTMTFNRLAGLQNVSGVSGKKL
jgi:hypothetical protein